MLPNTERYVNHGVARRVCLWNICGIWRMAFFTQIPQSHFRVCNVQLKHLRPLKGESWVPCLSRWGRLSVEEHWHPLTADKHWRIGMWKSRICVTFCRRTVRLAGYTLHSAVQTNSGKCVFCVQKSTPQAGINHECMMGGKICCDRWTWWRTRVQSETCILRNSISSGTFSVFPLLTKMMNSLKSLHWTSGSANSSAARYLDKARPKEEANLCDLFIESYFRS